MDAVLHRMVQAKMAALLSSPFRSTCQAMTPAMAESYLTMLR
jgi:hypothetical protein